MMFKKAISSVLIVFVFGLALGQDKSTPPSNQDNISSDQDFRSLYFDPLSVFLGTFKMGYEQEFPRTGQGVLISPQIRYNKLFGHQRKGGGLELQYRIYLDDEGRDETEESHMEGYVAPFTRYRYTEVTYTRSRWTGSTTQTIQYKNTYSNFDGGITFGIKTDFARFFVLDFFFGGGFRYTVSTGQDPDTGLLNPGYSGVIPKLGLSIGADF